MKRILTLVVLVPALLMVGQVFASEVTDVQLSYAAGSTVATINVDGAVRFTHQTEEAKDGKPFRVIVDVLSATHNMGSYNFMSLPACPVLSIRSSQYAVQPEAIVRIVFDMESEQVYRVDSDNKSIMLFFADKSQRSFAPWSTASSLRKDKAPATTLASEVQVAEVEAEPEPVKKSVEELNKSIDNDRLSSLESKPNGAVKVEKNSEQPVAKPVVETQQLAGKPEPEKPAPKKVVKDPPKLSQANSLYGPFADVAVEEQAKPAVAEKKVAEKPVEKPLVVASVEKQEPKPAAETAPVKPAEKPVVNQAEKVAEKPSTPQAPVQAQQSKPESESVAAKQPEQNVEGNQVADDGGAAKKSTSRFRRTVAESKKVKGTLVAEFPQRLVIKYKGSNHRDPFATLLDESKTYDNPVERQVPNVEGLKLVGVIEAGSTDNRALFEDKDGYGYILKTGDKVQKGYVLRVESDRVYFQIFEYGWSRTVALNLES
ncbi:MAG: hypothetical protein AB1483_06660 [Candidatus Zixiibacteriota bacterium]